MTEQQPPEGQQSQPQAPPQPAYGAPTQGQPIGPSHADRFSPPEERPATQYPDAPSAEEVDSGPVAGEVLHTGPVPTARYAPGELYPPVGQPGPVGEQFGPLTPPPGAHAAPTGQPGSANFGGNFGGGFGGSPGDAGQFGAPASSPRPAGDPEKFRIRRIMGAVVALALIVGLLAGGLGALAVNAIQDNDEPGRAAGGLDDVDLQGAEPLPVDNDSIAAVADKLLPSTVQIAADADGQELGATGSGFVLDKQGHIVTNNHVIESAAESDGKIQIIDYEGKRYDATVVGRSPVYDLAVLFVPDMKGAEPASLGSSKNMRIGENVVAFGAPLGLGSTVTSGIVSALDRPVTTGDSADDNSYINAVQTDAAINPGNSGGPLVNMRGQVVGVNSAIATTGGNSGGAGSIGVGFAIPVEQVRVTVDQILRDGEATYPVIGAQVRSDGTGKGAVIESVENNSPADDAGVKAGDVVVRLDNRLVTDSPTLIVAIRTNVAGETVTMTVERNGTQKKIDVELEGRVG